MVDVASTGVELAVIADNVERLRARVADLAEPYRSASTTAGSGRDDIVTAIDEAERQLRSARRTLERAVRVTGER
jgi:ABC-type transporter Mla subunit MlaD